jgi:hypothetical protein
LNPIVEALLKDFCSRQEIDASRTGRAFENFAAYCILRAHDFVCEGVGGVM